MNGVANRVRRFVVDRVPVATGVVALGDAQQRTDPSFGPGDDDDGPDAPEVPRVRMRSHVSVSRT